MNYTVKWTNEDGKTFEEWFGTHDGAVRFCEFLHRDIGRFQKPPGIHREDWEQRAKKKRKKRKKKGDK